MRTRERGIAEDLIERLTTDEMYELAVALVARWEDTE